MGLTAKLLGILVLAPPGPVPSASLPPAPDGRGQPGFSSSFFLMALPVNASIPRGPMAAPGEGVDGQPRCPHPCFPPRKPKTVLPSAVRGAGWQPGLFLNFPPPASAFSLQTKPCRLFFPAATRTWPLLSVLMASALVQALVLFHPDSDQNLLVVPTTSGLARCWWGAADAHAPSLPSHCSSLSP